MIENTYIPYLVGKKIDCDWFERVGMIVEI